jgi:RHS repeat-associated protein
MTFTYDAENRQISETNSGGLSATYLYDGDGKRVEKLLNNGQKVVYVYDALGKLAAEYDLQNSETPPPSTTCYLSYDHLGSLRMVTDQNANVVGRHDYIPFGEEIPGGIAGRSGQFGSSDSVSQKFTGKERDTETSLDYFGARYYTAGVERFLSADPENAGSDPGDPQSWNGYAYARSNPLLLVDPTGRNYTVCDQQGQNCTDLTDQQWSDFRDQNGIGQQAGGQLYVTNENGSYTNVGTATYYNERDVQAANFLNYQVAPVVNGLGYATVGVMAGAAVGAGYGAIAGGARLIGSISIASGPAIFQAGQTVDRIVNTSQGSVRFVAEVETSGSQLILKDILVYPTETGGRLQAGAGQILQAAKGFLQEARQDGFTSVRFIGDRSLAEGSANPGRVVDFTRTLK